MANKITDKVHENATVNLDGNVYERCKFAKCVLVYSGGDIPHISHCHIDACEWRFDGAADRTIAFLKGLYHGMGAAGQELVEATFKNIRNR